MFLLTDILCTQVSTSDSQENATFKNKTASFFIIKMVFGGGIQDTSLPLGEGNCPIGVYIIQIEW